jgi:glycerol-1-phosphate dehydrogenase [NAD(P)+]
MKSIQIGVGLINDLPDVIRTLCQGNRILMVSDTTAITYGQGLLKAKLDRILAPEFSLLRLILEPDHGDQDIHATEYQSQRVQKALEGVDCVLGVGGGTITDICKLAVSRHNKSVPLLILQTMLSVNAFSDGVSVIFSQGVKRTLPSVYPTALVVDLDLVRQAPRERTLSGFGDLLATWTAPADWLLSHRLGMNPVYHPAPYTMMAGPCRELLGQSEALGRRDSQATELLAETLTISGLAMGVAGESSPCSGTEHTISHLIDMRCLAEGRPLAYHGAQVAVATLISACAWDIFLQEYNPGQQDSGDLADGDQNDWFQKRVEQAFGGGKIIADTARECWGSYSQKLIRWQQKGSMGLKRMNWESLKSELKPILFPPEYLAACLQKAGAPTRFSQLTPPVAPNTALWAIQNCHLYRDRFTLADLLFFLGWWNEGFVDRVLERLEKVDAGL